MVINRIKFIDETSGQLDAAFDVMDRLLAVIEHYVLSDEGAGGNGYGCFDKPLDEVKRCFVDNQIDEFIKYT